MTGVVPEDVMPALTTIVITTHSRCNRWNFTHMQKNYMPDYKNRLCIEKRRNHHDKNISIHNQASGKNIGFQSPI